jgi:hypothetical protein
MFGHVSSCGDFLWISNDQERALGEIVQPGGGFSLGSNTSKLKTSIQRDQGQTDTYFNDLIETMGSKIIEILKTPLSNSQEVKKEKKQQKVPRQRNKRNGRKNRSGVNDMEESSKVTVRKEIRKVELSCRGESRLPIIAKPIFCFIRDNT